MTAQPFLRYRDRRTSARPSIPVDTLMRFITLQDDPWRAVCADAESPDPVAPSAHRLLDIFQWRAVRAQWPLDTPVGLSLANDFEIESLVPDLPRLTVVALHFPKWVDGRAYSQARLLRARWRYTGEIRATGEVLVDMLPLLARTGFDAVVLRADQSEEAARRALGFFPGHYQGDVEQSLPLFARPPGTAVAHSHRRADLVGGARDL
ncbi:MAG: DUF934 domain-containing protein [Burkholderiaceae bacterium]